MDVIRCCYNCTFRSWNNKHKLNLCDFDKHEIKDIYMELCSKYESDMEPHIERGNDNE